VSGVAKAHSQCDRPPTFQLVSSGATTGLPRIVAEGGVGRLRLARSAVERLRDGARRHRQAKTLMQQRRDLGVRDAQVLVENADQRDRLRAEMDGGRPQRIRGLQRMAALQAAVTAHAVPDVHIETPHDRLHDRPKFWIAGRSALRAGQDPLTRYDPCFAV
jgi:hypothetical protein